MPRRAGAARLAARAISGSADQVACLLSSVLAPGTHAHQDSWPAPQPPPRPPAAPAGGNSLIPGCGQQGCHCSYRHNPPSRPCPAPPPALCPPGMRQRQLTSIQRPTIRAKGHQTTCPERQAPGGMGGGVAGLPREARSLWLSDPTRWDASPKAHSLPLCLKCHHWRNHSIAKPGELRAYCEI